MGKEGTGRKAYRQSYYLIANQINTIIFRLQSFSRTYYYPRCGVSDLATVLSFALSPRVHPKAPWTDSMMVESSAPCYSRRCLEPMDVDVYPHQLPSTATYLPITCACATPTDDDR